MKVLVTGASGFVGTHLARRLVQDGHDVYAVVRSTSAVDELTTLNVHLIYTDEMHEQGTFQDIFLQHPDIEVVFHLASIVTLASVDYQWYWKINVQGTQHLLDACRAIRLRAFVYCSSVGVIGPLPDIPANEETRCAPDSTYGKTKYEAERLALQYFHEYDLPVAVVRPAWIYGPGDQRTLTFFRMIARGYFVMIGDGKTRISPVHVDDVVQALMLCAARIDQVKGEVFIAAGKESVSLENLASLAAREAGSRIFPVKIPAKLAKMAAVACEYLCQLIHVEPPLHRQRLNFYFRHQAFDISKIQHALGYAPQIDAPTGIKRTLQWYKEHNWL